MLVAVIYFRYCLYFGWCICNSVCNCKKRDLCALVECYNLKKSIGISPHSFESCRRLKMFGGCDSTSEMKKTEKGKNVFDPDVIRTRNLLIWSQTRYRCATESLEIAVRNYNFKHQQISTNTLKYGYCFIAIHEIELLIANCNLMSRKLFFSQKISLKYIHKTSIRRK